MRQWAGPFCQMEGCSRRAATITPTSLCLSHLRRLEWLLQLFGLTLQEYTWDMASVNELLSTEVPYLQLQQRQLAASEALPSSSHLRLIRSAQAAE